MGSIYKLNIKMPKEDLMLLNSIDKKVVLVKENSESSGNSNGFIDEVAWVTFQLWGDNKVTWENKYSVYVSETQKQSRAVIEKASDEEDRLVQTTKIEGQIDEL